MFEDPSENRTSVTRPRDENFDIVPTVKSTPENDNGARRQQSFWAILAIAAVGLFCAALSVGLFYVIRSHQHTVIPTATSGPDMTTTEPETEPETTEVFSESEEESTTESESETETAESETETTEKETETTEKETTETEAETTETETETTETETETTEIETETTEKETKKSKKKKKKSEKETQKADESAQPSETETQPSETPAEPAEFEYGGVIFRTNGDGLTLVKCYSADAIMEMGPVDGVPITGIGADAFSGCDHLIQINLPEGLVRIGENAFGNCRNLTEVWIPASVTEIADNAFENSPQAVIVSAGGTAAEAYAGTHGITFRAGSNISALD